MLKTLPLIVVFLGFFVLPVFFHSERLSFRFKLILLLAVLVPGVAALWFFQSAAVESAALLFLSLAGLMFFYFGVCASIQFDVRFVGQPGTNTLYLAFGAILANLLGGIGATLILAGPILRANAHRRNSEHITIFFVLIVSALGGLLGPLSAPNVYLLYALGVEPDWFLNLLPAWLRAEGLLLLFFFVYDWLVSLGEPLQPDPRKAISDGWYSALSRQEAPQSLILRTIDYLDQPTVSLKGVPAMLMVVGTAAMIFLLHGKPFEYYQREIWLILAGSLGFLFSLYLRSKQEEPEPGFKSLRIYPFVYSLLFYALICFCLLPLLLGMKDFTYKGISDSIFLNSGWISIYTDNVVPTLSMFFYGGFHEAGAILQKSAGDAAFMQALVEHPGAEDKLKALLLATALGGGVTYAGNFANYLVKQRAEFEGIGAPGFVKFTGVALLALGPIFAMEYFLLLM